MYRLRVIYREASPQGSIVSCHTFDYGIYEKFDKEFQKLCDIFALLQEKGAIKMYYSIYSYNSEITVVL